MSNTDDWAVAAAVIPHCYRALLYGPPGTGKTTLGFSGDDEPYYIPCHDELSVAEVIGHFIPVGNRFIWLNGPGLAAAVEGRPLVIDEIDLASGSVLSFLRALLNDPDTARFTVPDPALASLADDELALLIAAGDGLKTVAPADGFRVIATMNGEPEDLDGPLLDRFDAVLPIRQTNPEAIRALPEDLRMAAERTSNNLDPERRIGLRRWKAFANLRENVTEEIAGRAVFGPRYGDVIDALRLSRGAAPKQSTPKTASPSPDPSPAPQDGETLPAIYRARTGRKGRPATLECPEHGKLTHINADERSDGLYCKGRNGRTCGVKIAEPDGFSVKVLRDGEWVNR